MGVKGSTTLKRTSAKAGKQYALPLSVVTVGTLPHTSRHITGGTETRQSLHMVSRRKPCTFNCYKKNFFLTEGNCNPGNYYTLTVRKTSFMSQTNYEIKAVQCATCTWVETKYKWIRATLPDHVKFKMNTYIYFKHTMYFYLYCLQPH